MTSLNNIAFRHKWSLLLLACVLITVIFGISHVSANRAVAPADSQPLLSALLKPDGTLDLSRGFQGSLNPQGFQLQYADNGAPRFVPAAPTVGETWDTQFVNANGAHTFGYAVAVIGTDVYVGGAPLESAGNAMAKGVAKWNGSTWSALGSGVNGDVYALAVSGTDLYVAGDFTTAGGISANNVAKWNGSAWSALGSGVDGLVFALATSGSDVYVGGSFSMAGGNAAANIARWNGSAWSALGSGTNQQVAAIAISGSNVYAGGEFTMAGGNPANYVARWNGSAWSALGSGMDFTVNALAVSGSDLYVGGAFSSAGGNPANSIARWNGSAWSALGSGITSGSGAVVRSILVVGSNVYAGGLFETAGGNPATNAARWNGSAWSVLGNGLASGRSSNNTAILSMVVSGSDVYAAGGFTKSGSTEINGIARWNGTTWSPLGSSSNSVNYNVYAVAVLGNDVYVGGEFDFAGGIPASNIAKWNGSAWSALGSGVNRVVRALAVSGTTLYAGGEFTTAGGSPASFVARWNGSAWSALGSGITNGVGVNALAISGTNIYAGGFFFTAGGNSAGNIARWNGSAWSALGSGTSGEVKALAISGSDLYAGGQFSTPGAKVAKWNGSSWSALGTGITGAVAIVNALAVSGTDVYVGGVFGTAGGNPILGLAKWNGSAWSQLGGGLNGFVFSLLSSGSDLYVGGNFDTAGGTPVSGLAKWNGSTWSGLGASTGTNGFSNSLGLQGTSLFVGGTFTALSGTLSHYFGRFGCSAITLAPTTLPNGAVSANYNQTLTASPAGSYTFALINGSLPKGLTLSSGGVISGAPTEFGLFNFTVRANGGSCMGSRQYTLAVTGTACAIPNFTNRADFNLGTFPRDVVSGDFNKDGKADLVTANPNSSNLTVLLGNGLGSFPTITNVAVPNGAVALATGDFNSDGNIDLVTASSVSNSATVLFGDGTGAFPTSASVNFGAIQGGVQAGDFNGDGKLDFLVTIGNPANQLSVRLGNGAGGFSVAPGSPLTLGFSLSSNIALNDFNQDGKLDLAIGQNGVGQVSILFGAGDGSFAAGTPITVISTPINVGSADFNLDGKPDLAVTHLNSSLTVLLGNGLGGFSATPDSPLANAAAYLPGDFNGDGIPDLAAPQRISYGNGSGGFTSLTGLNTGSDRQGLTFGDFNGDGKPDLAVVNGSPNLVAVVFNNCAPSMVAAAPLTRQQGSSAINSFIGTVSDVETAAGSLSVILISPVPTGINVTNIVNTNGTITADVVANCNAATGPRTLVFQVFDGALATTPTLTVNVTANTPPVLTYPATPIPVASGGSITVNPLTGPSDNGSISSVSVDALTFRGAISVNSAGVVSISNAGPAGTHTITVTTADNCNATTTTTFTLTVGCFNSLTVNNLGDGADAVPGNNICETAAGNGVCTLRAALAEAHAQIACAPFTINFAVTGTINLNSGLPDIYHPDLTLNGPGAQQLTVRSNTATPIPIFRVDDNNEFSVKRLTVNGMTLRDANSGIISNPGGQVTVNDCVVVNNQVGLIASNGSLTVNNTVIAGNTATDAGSVGLGAAVGAVGGTLTMTNCTISGNTNTLTGDLQASALLVVNASATLTNCTISGNTGDRTISLTTVPGIPNNPTLTLTNCTVAGNTLNSATTAYGVLEARGDGVLTPTLQLKNTLVAGNTTGIGANFRTVTGGTVTSQGNNLDSDGSSGFTNGVNGNLVGTVANPLNALLAGLGNYGGATQTIALLPGSPAINAGTSSGAPATDQRGIARVGNVDIGAFESRGFTMALSGGNNQSAATSTAFANPLAVAVSSAFSEPVNGGRVTFAPPGSGASATIAGNPATIAGGVAASGLVTANAVVGAYNVAASASGATPINFSLTNLNTAPSFTPALAISRQQGSPAGAAVTIGTVTDAQTPAGSLTVTPIAGGTATGINVTGVINTNGTITAVVSADCTAVGGTVRFQVSDGSLTGTGDLQVNVTTNTAPTLSYANVSLNAGSATTNSPTTATDNGNINLFAVQSQGTYSGTISVNASGVVSISNAAPVGSHTITIRATDNCGATTDAQFTLMVGNNLPTITPSAALTRQQGTAGSVSTIATVSDNDTPPGNLVVTATNVPAGITITSIVNSGGTISANIAAGCNAAVGANSIGLTVTDSNNGMATANLTVNVTANSAPSLSYPVSGVAMNAATTITPTTAGDNGSITGYQIVSVSPPLTTAPTVDSSGVVSVTNAAPFGLHTITVRATDNCGATTDAQFTLNVGCGSLTVTPATLINGLTFVPYTSTLSASGGSGTYTFTLTSGVLPAGLNLSGNTISGTPNTAGASTFTIRATDENGCFGEQSYTLLIGSTGLKYYPLSRPVRLLDTRPGQSPNACHQPNAPIAAGTARLQPARGVCEGLTIPANATTITGNITTVQSGGGFITIYPSDAPRPLVANSNYNPNEVLNNAFTVGVGAQDGAVNIYVTSDTDVVIDVTGYYAPPATGGLYFHPLPRPVRLLETRAGFTGCFAPGQPLQGGTNTPQLGTGNCQGLTIPPDALALVGNATTVNPQGAGYLTLYPANATQPLVASSNYATGQVVNGPFTVGLSPSGQFNIFTQATTDLVVDITGYYSAQANDANGAGLLFTSLGSPLRLLDTRANQQGCYTPGAPMTGNAVYTQETQSPCTNLTPTARALIGNATVVNTTAEGYLTFWPADATQPLVATSNYVAGQVFNRYFTVGLSGNGSFNRFARRTTDLVIDISGFFAP